MYKILWIWEIVVDKTYFLDEFPKESLKFQSTDSIEWVWWPVPTALKFLQNMWCEVELIWTVWDDYWATFLEKELEKYNIKTNFIYNKSTKINTILVNNNSWERTIIKDLDRNNKIEKIDIEKIKNADAIIFDRTEKKVFDFILEYKREDAIVIVDTSTEYNEKIIDFLKKSTKAIIPVEIIDSRSLELTYNDLSTEGLSLLWELIITDWWNWTHIFDWKSKKTIKWDKINVVDTNWAWDVFRGAYAWGLLQKWNTEKIVKFANKVAWLQCTKKWNLIAVPDKKDLN